MIDLLILNVAWIFSTLLIELQDGVLDIHLKSTWLREAPIDVLLPFLVLMGFRSCSRAWSLAGVIEYAALGVAGILGGVLVFAINLLRLPAGAAPWNMLAHILILFGLAVPCMVGVRAFIRTVQDLMHRPGRVSPADPKSHLRTLIAGNGPDLMLYFRRRMSGLAPEADTVIAGVVSSDDALRGHYICGFNVLGNPDDLPALIHQKNIHRLVWVGEMSADERSALRQYLPDTGVQLAHWKVTEDLLELAEL